MYLSIHILVCRQIDQTVSISDHIQALFPVNHSLVYMLNAQLFFYLLFNVDDLFLANPSSPLLVYVPTDIPTMKQPVKFYVVLLANHEDTLVYSVVDQYAHRSIHLFINLPAHLYAFFRLATKTYLSTHLVVCLPSDLPVHQPSCSLLVFFSLGLP